MSALEVRQAGPEDAEEIVDILSETARWLRSRGIEQWPDPFPCDRVEALVARGEFFLASLGGRPVATFALLWSDPVFWGERPADSGYVHALAVRRSAAGQGLGRRLLNWAARRVAAEGREFLRLDCRTDNAHLRRYYERLGFEPRGEAVVDDLVAVLFERRCVREWAGSPSRGRSGETGTQPARSRHRRVRFPAVRSQRERGSPETPPNEGGGCLEDLV